MVEYPERVHLGIRIMMQCLGVDAGDHRRRAEQARRHRGAARDHARRTSTSIVSLAVKYPQGAEKMLIQAVLGREVPSGKLPVHVGVARAERGVGRHHRRGLRDGPAAHRAHRHGDGPRRARARPT